MQDPKSLAAGINGKEWIKIGRWIQAVSFAYSNISGRTSHYNIKTLGWDFEFKNFLFLDWEYQFEKSEFEEMKAFFLSKIAKNPDYFREYEKIVRSVSDAMIAHSEQYLSEKYVDKSSAELKKRFKGFYETVNEAQPVLEGYQLIGELLEQKIRSLLGAYLKNVGKAESIADEYLKDLTIPKNKIPTVEEAERLLRIASVLQERKLDVRSKEADQLLADHIAKYRYINTHHFLGDPDDNQLLYERLDSLLKKDCAVEIEKYETHRKNEQQRLLELQTELSEESELLNYIDIARDLAYLKPYRVDAYYIAWINFRPLFEEIGKRVGATVDDLMCLTDLEIEQVIDTNVINMELVNERRGDFAIVKIDGELEIVSGEKLVELKSLLKKEDYSHITEVTGVMAFKGHLRGIARVLHSEADIKNVQVGDILVITMTDPNYISAMEKAAGFVTDFGGILCHAAIIAREMAKPCVIGTNLATRVFKDGDLIELDANKGVVRKVS